MLKDVLIELLADMEKREDVSLCDGEYVPNEEMNLVIKIKQELEYLD